MTLRIPREPTGPWRDLSPDMPAPIVVGLEWPTATHFFEASRHWFDHDLQRAIADEATPDDARRLAAQPSIHDRQRTRLGTIEDPHIYWRGTWPHMIRRAIYERAVTDVAFVGTLVETSDEHLVLGTDEPWIGRPHNGWGRGLMEMRETLSKVNVATLRSWWRPPYLEHPEIPIGSIGWRMGTGEVYWMAYDRWRMTLDPAEADLFKTVYPAWPRRVFWPDDRMTPFLAEWDWDWNSPGP